MTPTPRLPHLEALYGSMPTLALDTGSTIVVTGVNGLVGSHIANQLLKRGYNVRGVVRDAEKHQYLVEYFSKKHRYAKFELVSLLDMTVEGCYDDLVEGVGGFVQVASPMGDTLPVDEAIAVATKGAVNGLKACAKVPSCKRFVFTSSSIAATFPYPDEEMTIDVNSYNDEALKALREDPDKPGLYTYAAMKVETEKAMRRWMEENKPDFNLIFVLPNVNFGPVLIPEHQGYPSSINWAHLAWKGEHLEIFTTFACAQWYVHPVDCALVHVSALIYNDVGSERLFAFAEPWDYNKILSTWRKLYPERKFQKPIEGLGVDKMKIPNKRAEELLMWVKGAGWDSLEKGLKEMTESWA